MLKYIRVLFVLVINSGKSYIFDTLKLFMDIQKHLVYKGIKPISCMIVLHSNYFFNSNLDYFDFTVIFLKKQSSVTLMLQSTC